MSDAQSNAPDGQYQVGNQGKLSLNQVEAIRERYTAGGVTQKSLANEYGVSQQAIQKLLRRPKSSTRGNAKRPGKKPHKDFPLSVHPRGQWCKKVRGKLWYFGSISGDEGGQQALQRWLEQKDDILVGRTPRSRRSGCTVADACNKFLAKKEQRVESGELSPRTFERYFSVCQLLAEFFGRDTIVENLYPDDFADLRALMAKKWGPVALGNEIRMVRSVFKHAEESGLVKARVSYGPDFRKPSAKVLRQNRVKKGPRLFDREQILAVLDHATLNMRAMLGIQCGLGNTDVARLPTQAVDLRGGWLNYPKAKTAIPRKIPLWAETLAAIKDVIDSQPDPINPEDAKLLFLGTRGQNYIGNHRGYRVHQEFIRVCKKAKVTGRTFYDLRRTFQTVSEDAADLVATQSIMGHAPQGGDMSALYRQRVSDKRLCAVVEAVHHWLFAASNEQSSLMDCSKTTSASLIYSYSF